MKTKKFLLATAGATVDGRTIDADMLQQMADSYDPATYTARLNIEHIRGLTPGGQFGAYGDVVELSTDDVDVNFNGKTEKRKGLFGVFEVTEEAKALNSKGQKLFPSIEINPDFGQQGFAYLMGCALTDSPASIATQKLQFNRSLPGCLTVGTDKADQAFALEFADADGSPTEAAEGWVAKFGAMLDSVLGKHAAKADDKPADEPKAGEFNVADLKPLFEGFATDIAAQIDGMRQEFRSELDQVAVQIKELDTERETTPTQNHAARPKASGTNGADAMTDC